MCFAMRETILLKVDPIKPDLLKIRRAANMLKNGGLVAFPTETVYGLGADALNANAVKALFWAKKRPIDNPPIVHIEDRKNINKLVAFVPSQIEILMEQFWPGPLTLVFRRSDMVPAVTVAGLETIAVRMPKHEVALSLIRESGCPISAPSANLSGKPSSTTANHVFDDLNGRIDAVLDGGPTQIGVESTVLDVTVDPPTVLRPGGTSLEALKEVLRRVRLHAYVKTGNEHAIRIARSPGMKHIHYAPRAKLVLVEGPLNTLMEKVIELVGTYKAGELRVGVLATDETASKYEADIVLSMGSRFDLETIARNLFASLRKFDSEGIDVVVAESVPMDGLGLAVMNRLRRASGYNIVKV